MAYTTIDNPKKHFNISLYTGTGSSQAITGVGFQPDLVWTKGRSVAYSHYLFDSTRGVQKRLMANNTNAEDTLGAGVTAFGTDGFTHGGEDGIGENTKTFVGWSWKANGGTTANNTDGDIDSVTQANTTAGFSIVTYTGDGTAGQKVGHGLGTSLGLLITKNRDASAGWATAYASQVTGDSLGGLAEASFSTISATDAFANNSTSILATGNTSVFAIGTGVEMNTNGEKYVAYCFSERKGYSQIGSFAGNGSTNGPFIYTGFKPRFLLFRSTSTCHTVIVDSTRSTTNVIVDSVYTDTAGTEIDPIVDVDFYSNGFKWRGVLANETNVSGQTYVYYAVAENPFVTSKGTPTTAK